MYSSNLLTHFWVSYVLKHIDIKFWITLDEQYNPVKFFRGFLVKGSTVDLNN